MPTRIATLLLLALTSSAPALAAPLKITETPGALRVTSACFDLTLSSAQPAITAIALDSLGLGKFAPNSLRQPASAKEPFQVHAEGDNPVIVQYRRPGAANTAPAGWQFEIAPDAIHIVSTCAASESPGPLVLQFDPKKCHATLLGIINPDTSIRLPALLHLPDQGTLRITTPGVQGATLGYDARRAGQGYVQITFPAATHARPRLEYLCQVTAIYPPLAEAQNDPRFAGFRRNWLNIFQLNPRLRVLANHAASDTCAFCIYEYADIALHTPPLADGLSAMDLVRQSVDRYLEGLAGYGLPGSVGFDMPGPPSNSPAFLDTYPSLLIAAADYVEKSNDRPWLERQYAGLRGWAEKLLAMDHDGNGLFEYPASGNSYSWPKTGGRPSNWWDTIGFGHEDAWANALAFRALRSTADMAVKLGRADDAARYRAAAQKLHAAYFKTFYNPATGVLAGWRSADGQLHDYYFLFVNGAAIHYGLVPKDKANAIMDRLLAKMKDVGYRRFDLGLPGNLVSVARRDYFHLDRRWGGGAREDNADGFQIYENGGATASFAYFTLAALYDLGRRDQADRILFPMLDAFEKGSFQGRGPNGMSNDWKTWDGTPWGYEGFLVDNYYALLAVLTRSGGDRTGQ